MNPLQIAIAATALALPLVHAEPIVLGDFGGQPTGVPSLESIKEAGGAIDVKPVPRELNQFPIHTRMTVGVVERRSHSREVAQPFFIVGVDPASRTWLEANREALQERRALGLVTAVATQTEVEEIRAIVPDLRVVAVPVDEIAQTFDLAHYPVLIDAKEIVQ